MSLEKNLTFQVPASELAKHAVYSGTISKQDKKVGVIWRKRFCVLMYTSSDDMEDTNRYGNIYMFTSLDDKRTKSKVDLRKTVKDVEKTKKNGIKIELTSGRCFYFSCSEKSEVDLWYRYIQEASQGKLSTDARDANSFLLRSKATHKIRHEHYVRGRSVFIKQSPFLQQQQQQQQQQLQQRLQSSPVDGSSSGGGDADYNNINHNNNNNNNDDDNDNDDDNNSDLMLELPTTSTFRKKLSTKKRRETKRGDVRSRVFSLQKPPSMLLREELEPWIQWSKEYMHYGARIIKFPYMGASSGRPKRRFMSISKDESRLMWGTTRDVSLLNRSVSVNRVEQVIYGPFSLTMNRYAFVDGNSNSNPSSIAPWRCISIVIKMNEEETKNDEEVSGSTREPQYRTIDLQFSSDSETLAWYVGLQSVCPWAQTNVELSQFKWTKLRLQMEQKLFLTEQSVSPNDDNSIASMIIQSLDQL